MTTQAPPRRRTQDDVPRSGDSPVVPVEHRRRAEQATIGSMIRDRLVIPDVVRLLPREEMLGLHHHQLAYRAVVDLHADARPIDLVAVADLLRERGQLADAGGYGYLAELWESAPSAANAEYYAKIVLEHHLLTQAAFAADELGREARSPTGPAADLIGAYEQRLSQLAESGTVNEPVTLQAALEGHMHALEARLTRGQDAGIPTGFPDLDAILIGLQPGEMVVVGARPSVGKTTLGLCLARNLAHAGRATMFVSLEQSRNEICERLLARESLVDSYRMRTGKLSAEDHDAIVNAGSTLRKWRLHIDDSPNQTMTTIAANARRVHRKHGLDALFVDYLQLVTPDNPRANRYEQVGGVSRRLKQLARDLKIPVVVMCQVGRDAGDGDAESPPPKLHQMRESGNIEQDLDVCLLLHRAEKGDIANGKPEVIRVEVAKNRNGRRGLLLLAHRPQFQRFESFDQGVNF